MVPLGVLAYPRWLPWSWVVLVGLPALALVDAYVHGVYSLVSDWVAVRRASGIGLASL